jgi:hypothetical protein
MADFVAVLKKTIDGLGDTTPTMRERVYEKARATVAAKLAAINPPPPAAVADRQKKSLEDAIKEIEAGYSARSADPLEELEDIFASLDGSKPIEAAPAKTPGSSFEVKPVAPAAPASKSSAEKPALAGTEQPEAELKSDFQDAADDDEDAYEDFNEPVERRRGIGGIIAALVLLALIGGGAYAAWLNKDELSAMLGLDGSKRVAAAPTETAPEPAESVAETPAAETPEEDSPAADAPAPPPPASDTMEATPPASAPAEAPAQPGKFTQRLNVDGSEVDEGSAAGAQTIGEGTSVAAVTQPPQPAPTPPATDLAAPAGPPAIGTTPAPGPPAAAEPAVAVGQKAIFYEERTNVAQGSADTGTIVWSVVQESPGGDLPPEPAIRAEATIPGKDLQLRMTIRRNGDPTLPASHIIEMIFLTPEGFEGGGIENILRVSLKDTEQSAGNPLLGIPAKIADGFFLVALTDTKAEMDANLALLRRDQWIDVPLVYKSGRRALITIEKGIPGDKVFDETLKAWETKTADSAG